MKYTNCHIKKNDQVMVIAGKEKGKIGKVLSVNPEKERVIVERVNFIKRHTRPSARYRQGGIIEKEGAIHISNVLVVCPKCNKAGTMGNRVLEDAKKVRVCKKCGETLAN
ncbi:MAG TPA: 50S ribosomal protein L24 [Thermodesulfobacteriota bacterium]|nr:50S ribosomal protein L24 [Thermodesulfobacteriota bacterium]